jgi:hypothetical protein
MADKKVINSDKVGSGPRNDAKRTLESQVSEAIVIIIIINNPEAIVIIIIIINNPEAIVMM